jgi:hypothetical protein
MVENKEFNKSFFRQFSWCVPSGFSLPLSNCRFEEGDTLYDCEDGYRDWTPENKKKMNHYIQVRYPKRLRGILSDEEVYSVFKQGWGSTCEIDLYDVQNDSKQVISTTQGRVYTMLWKGGVDVLSTNSPAPPIPLLYGDIKKNKLKEYSTFISKEEIFNHLFFMVYDLPNSLTTTKIETVSSELSKHFEVYNKDYLPKELNLKGWESFLPTLRFKVFKIMSNEHDKIFSVLKGCLYKPSKDKKTDVDRFDLGVHGVLL